MTADFGPTPATPATTFLGLAVPQLVTAVSVASTSSTADVMAGLAIAFKPLKTGYVKVAVTLQAASAVAAAGNPTIDVRYGTGTAPIQGAAATGTVMGLSQTEHPSGTATPNNMAVVVMVKLTVGTLYWIDLGYNTAVAADAVSLAQVNVVVEELPT